MLDRPAANDGRKNARAFDGADDDGVLTGHGFGFLFQVKLVDLARAQDPRSLIRAHDYDVVFRFQMAIECRFAFECRVAELAVALIFARVLFYMILKI